MYSLKYVCVNDAYISFKMTESSPTPGNSENIVNTQQFDFGLWTVTVKKSHILHSRCSTPVNCQGNGSSVPEKSALCHLCRYERELKLPQLPEMTFPKNSLRIQHKAGFAMEFNCLDALKCVDSKRDPMKVAVAEAWQEARAGNSHIRDVVKRFDWTFSTDYMGTISPFDSLKINPSEDRIDIEKLKVKEKILFYEDVILFEDELADNGMAQCSVKIRVMQDSFFILLRYFLRIDNLCAKTNDTRIYHEVDKNYVLREFTHKACAIQNLQIPVSVLSNPAELSNFLPIVKALHQKVEFPV